MKEAKDASARPKPKLYHQPHGRPWRLAPLRFRLYLVQTQPMSRVKRRFLYIGLAIATTLLVGPVVFISFAESPPFDAFYMTLITMTTVGYAEIHPLTQAGRIFNSFLIIFGVTTIFIAVGAMTQTIIEMEFGDAIGKRRNKRMIEKLKDPFPCGRLAIHGHVEHISI